MKFNSPKVHSAPLNVQRVNMRYLEEKMDFRRSKVDGEATLTCYGPQNEYTDKEGLSSTKNNNNIPNSRIKLERNNSNMIIWRSKRDTRWSKLDIRRRSGL